MRPKMLAVVVLLLMVGFAKAQEDGVPEARAFSISSLNTPFAMQGDFRGEYRIYPDRIEVRVTTTDIRISDHCPYKGRRLLASLKFGLATKRDGPGWKIATAGQEFLLEQVMRPGDMRSFGEMYFYIPIDESVDLSKHWFVVRMEDNVLDVPKEERRKGYAFAHSCKDIFTRDQSKCGSAAR